MPHPHYVVRWEGQSAHLMGRLGMLIEMQKFADVTLICEQQSMRAHRVVLAACSPYLDKLLSQETGVNLTLLFKDMRFTILKALVEFMYTGETSVGHGELGLMLKAAEHFQIQGLTDTRDAHAKTITTIERKLLLTDDSYENTLGCAAETNDGTEFSAQGLPESETLQTVTSAELLLDGAAESRTISAQQLTEAPEVITSEHPVVSFQDESSSIALSIDQIGLIVENGETKKANENVICTEDGMMVLLQNEEAARDVSHENGVKEKELCGTSDQVIILPTGTSAEEAAVIVQNMIGREGENYVFVSHVLNEETVENTSNSTEENNLLQDRNNLLLKVDVGETDNVSSRDLVVVPRNKKNVRRRNNHEGFRLVEEVLPDIPGQPPKRTWECLVCQKRYHFSFQLTIHRRYHTGERPYKCKVCNKGFVCAGDLTRHETCHRGDRPYKCDQCDKHFKLRSQVGTHMARVHLGVRPHICSICGNGFTDSSKLKSHILVHTGDKPYKCSECGKAFRTLSKVKEHTRAVHWPALLNQKSFNDT